jgi:hypothetical protein
MASRAPDAALKPTLRERWCAARLLRSSSRSRPGAVLAALLVVAGLPACGPVVPYRGAVVPARFQSEDPTLPWSIQARGGARCTAPCTLLVPVEEDGRIEITSYGNPIRAVRFDGNKFNRNRAPVVVTLKREESDGSFGLVIGGVPVLLLGGAALAAGIEGDCGGGFADMGCGLGGVLIAGGVAMIVSGLAVGTRVSAELTVVPDTGQVAAAAPPPAPSVTRAAPGRREDGYPPPERWSPR